MLTDIYDASAGVFLRNGWHALEASASGSFRWSRSDAKIVVTRFDPSACELRFDIEPGPGVVQLPAAFMVYDATGRQRFAGLLSGRTKIAIVLDSKEPTVHELRLCVEGGGNVSGLDYRALDFRLFSIDVRPVADVLSAIVHAKLGTGWYDLETFENESFRWVDNDARVAIASGFEGSLDFEIERGPSADPDSFELTIYDDADHIVTRTVADAREHVRIAARRVRGRELRLHVDGTNGRPAPDGRLLNVRVFVDRHE